MKNELNDAEVEINCFIGNFCDRIENTLSKFGDGLRGFLIESGKQESAQPLY